MGQIWISNGAAVLDSILIEPLNRTAECRVPAPPQHRCFPVFRVTFMFARIPHVLR
jgi:hypothetical protein